MGRLAEKERRVLEGSCYVWEGFAWGTRGRRKLYILTIKLTSSKTVAKDLIPSTDSFKSNVPQKKAYFSKN